MELWGAREPEWCAAHARPKMYIPVSCMHAGRERRTFSRVMYRYGIIEHSEVKHFLEAVQWGMLRDGVVCTICVLRCMWFSVQAQRLIS